MDQYFPSLCFFALKLKIEIKSSLKCIDVALSTSHLKAFTTNIFCRFSGCSSYFEERKEPEQVSSMCCRRHQTTGSRAFNICLSNKRSHQGKDFTTISTGKEWKCSTALFEIFYSLDCG